MKQQTAVEWLMNEIYRMNRKVSIFDLIEQAKEMEKQQIIDAYETSHISMMTSEQYYKETFKSE
jgi:hypothetical protein